MCFWESWTSGDTLRTGPSWMMPVWWFEIKIRIRSEGATHELAYRARECVCVYKWSAYQTLKPLWACMCGAGCLRLHITAHHCGETIEDFSCTFVHLDSCICVVVMNPNIKILPWCSSWENNVNVRVVNQRKCAYISLTKIWREQNTSVVVYYCLFTV